MTVRCVSLVDEGWYRLSTVLNFGIFNGPKRIQTPHSLFRDCGGTEEQIKPWQPVDKAAEFKLESKFDPLHHLAITPEGYSRRHRRVWLQNQRPTSWGRTPAQLGSGSLSGPRYMICVPLRRLFESENTRTCENCARNACNSRMSAWKRVQFSHVRVFSETRAILACQCVFWLAQRAKTCDKIWYLGPLPSLGWSDGKIEHRAFPSRLQSLRAATGSLEENVLPLLRYWLSSGVKKDLMLCNL